MDNGSNISINMRKRLQGVVINIKRTGEKRTDDEGIEWEKCIFEVELTGFSKGAANEEFPKELKRKRVKIVRWCAYDWHYKLGVKKTLESDESESILKKGI